MIIKKFICDCCGKEVKSQDGLESIGIREYDMDEGKFKTELYDICEECENKIYEATTNEFYKIKKENK